MSNQLNTEVIKVRVGLSGTYWDKKPEYTVGVNGTVYKQGSITAESGITEYVEFECEMPEGDNCLEIGFTNKKDSDVVENDDKSSILKDMLLNIDSIELDDIDLDSLKWTHSEFVAQDLNRPLLKSCINLGWNGTYKLQFTSPFYLWLLENT